MSAPRFEVVPHDSEDATRLLRAYLEELRSRLAGGHAMHDAWDRAIYGAPRARIVVAYVGNVPVACAGLREHARDACELKHFFVEKAARRAGLGAALVGEIEGHARDLGYRRVVLDTAAPLEEAARLYERSGYARVPAFNDNPYAAHWFEKKLPLDDRALWGAFLFSSLPVDEWTHVAHLRTAFLHLERHDIDEAHLRMRVGIIRLNAAHGLEENATRGYHETLTRAWLSIVAEARSRHDATDSLAFVNEHAGALDKTAPRRHYTRETILSLRARATFVPPDVAPLFR